MAGAKEGLGDRIGNSVETAGRPKDRTLIELVAAQRGGVERALPDHLKDQAGNYTEALITLLKQTPGLASCEPLTVLGGLMTASSLGLQFGPLGHCYLVPFRTNNAGTSKAQFILGYKGVIDLAWRSGKLASLVAHTVYDMDTFDFEFGLADRLAHTPLLKGDRGKPYAWYAVANFTEGGHAFVVLGKSDVDRHRKASKASGRGPWVDWYTQMAEKSAVLELRRFLPQSTSLARGLTVDGLISSGTDAEKLDYIDVIANDLELESPKEKDKADPQPIANGETGELLHT